MDNTTEVKAVAQRTKENVEKLVSQTGRGLSDVQENAGENLNQLTDETRTVLRKGVDGAQAQIKTAISDSRNAINQSKETIQEGVGKPPSSLIDAEVKAEAAEVKENIESAAGQAKSQMRTSLDQAKAAPSEVLKGLTRQMGNAGEAGQISASALKRRLDWGEPALTIIDVRHRESFNQEHIRGAISMPEADLIGTAPASLESEREIFIYGETTLQADQSVASLKQAGFTQVASISGGIPAWQSAGGATEGIAAQSGLTDRNFCSESILSFLIKSP